MVCIGNPKVLWQINLFHYYDTRSPLGAFKMEFTNVFSFIPTRGLCALYCTLQVFSFF